MYTLVGYNLTKLLFGIYKLKNNKYRKIYKEQFLKLSDYLFAYMYIIKKNKIIIKDIYYNKINITKLLESDLNNNHNIFSSIIALLNYRFIYRLKMMNYKIRTSVNWFENQPLDKAWNYGMNTYYPASNIHAYVSTLDVLFEYS